MKLTLLFGNSAQVQAVFNVADYGGHEVKAGLRLVPGVGDVLDRLEWSVDLRLIHLYRLAELIKLLNH